MRYSLRLGHLLILLDVDLQRRAHAGLHKDLAEQLAFQTFRPLLRDCRKKRVEVRVQICVGECALADLVQDKGAVVDSELDQTLLGLPHSLQQLIRLDQRATFYVRHQTLGAQRSGVLLEKAHLLLSSDDLVKD